MHIFENFTTKYNTTNDLQIDTFIFWKYDIKTKVKKVTIHEFGLALLPQSAQESSFQKAHCFQMDNEYKHMA